MDTNDPAQPVPVRKKLRITAAAAAKAAAAKAIEKVAPDVTESVPSISIDIENAFMLYATFCGDVERTAHALGIMPSAVIGLAKKEGWNEKLKTIIDLKKSNRPGDVERAINRALNFVDAHRFRLFIQRMIKWLCDLTPEQAEEYLTQEQGREKDGTPFVRTKLCTRPLADLAHALEKCQMMTYVALNDTVGERVRREDKADEQASGSEIHAQIATAMAAMRASPEQHLKDAQG